MPGKLRRQLGSLLIDFLSNLNPHEVDFVTVGLTTYKEDDTIGVNFKIKLDQEAFAEFKGTKDFSVEEHNELMEVLEDNG